MTTIGKPALILKRSCSGIGYSTVDLNDVRHVFAAAMPRGGRTVHQQAYEALETIADVINDEGAMGSIVSQTVFYSDPALLDNLGVIMRDFYGAELPAITYVPQHPCEGKQLAIEAMGIGRHYGEVQIERRSPQVVIARHNGAAWIHCGHIVPRSRSASIYVKSLNGFQCMRRLLLAEGISFDRVIRTWLYLGDIVGQQGGVPRYHELNRARATSYEGVDFGRQLVPRGYGGTVYPASTGIGIEGQGLVMSCMAFVAQRRDIIGAALENPRQTAAFRYGDRYSPASPRFARALALSCGTFAVIFISGTASITNSETRHIGDVLAQTRETLDNIEALISERNLRRHGLTGHGATLDDLAFARVYIKRPGDYSLVRRLCQARLGELPIIYLIADVCRPDLLVEIEGVACTTRLTRYS